MNTFAERHIGPRPKDVNLMLEKIGIDSLEELVSQTIPENIRLNSPMQLSQALNESELLDHMKNLGRKNKN